MSRGWEVKLQLWRSDSERVGDGYMEKKKKTGVVSTETLGMLDPWANTFEVVS